MREIPLNSILCLTDDEIENSKIELNMHYNDDEYEPTTFIEWWNDNFSKDDKQSGQCPECQFWGIYGKQSNFRIGQNAYSFARMPDCHDEWLFISAGVITGFDEDGWGIVAIDERLQPLFGRLVIYCEKGNTYSRYCFNLRKYIDECYVKEILPDVFEF